jgi:hypothetical protein
VPAESNERWALSTRNPSPLVLACISLMIMRISPMDSAVRIPATILGLAAGNTTRPMRWPRPRPKLRAMSSISGSTPRTPSMVLSRTGHTAPSTISAILEPSPIPITTSTNGSISGGGIERRNSITGRLARRTRGASPMSTPSATPVPTASA